MTAMQLTTLQRQLILTAMDPRRLPANKLRGGLFFRSLRGTTGRLRVLADLAEAVMRPDPPRQRRLTIRRTSGCHSANIAGER